MHVRVKAEARRKDPPSEPKNTVEKGSEVKPTMQRSNKPGYLAAFLLSSVKDTWKSNC